MVARALLLLRGRGFRRRRQGAWGRVAGVVSGRLPRAPQWLSERSGSGFPRPGRQGGCIPQVARARARDSRSGTGESAVVVEGAGARWRSGRRAAQQKEQSR